MRHYLKKKPSEELERFIEEYVEALWIEDRQMNVMAAVVAKALGGKS